MSRADVIRRIENILGVKKVGLSKREILSKLEEGNQANKDATRELEPVKEDPEAEDSDLTPKEIQGENDLFKKKKNPKTYKYIKSDTSAMNKLKFNKDYEQILPRTKSSIDFLKTLPLASNQLIPMITPTRVKISKIIRVMRPIIHCIALISQNKPKWGTLLTSVVLDLIALCLNLGFQGNTMSEREQLRKENWSMLFSYIFREPLWSSFFRPYIVVPFLNKVVRVQILRNLILQALDFKSCFALTM